MELSVPHRFINYSVLPQSRLCNQRLHLLPVHLKQRKVQLFSSTVLRAFDENNGASLVISAEGGRIGEVKRVTKETNVDVKINLDGNALAENNTGIPFLDHMLDQLASHGLFDVRVKATGDIHIDDHHTNEDIALAIGTALLQALGDRKGINRFGDFSAPLDEALVHVALDLSGRPHLSYNLCFPTERVGNYDTQVFCGMTLHIRQVTISALSFINNVKSSLWRSSAATLAGRNSHHIIEATFKAFARALRQATEYDHRRRGTRKASCHAVDDSSVKRKLKCLSSRALKRGCCYIYQTMIGYVTEEFSVRIDNNIHSLMPGKVERRCYCIPVTRI
ncbi:hypothetical protein BUALT_Bualt14G0092800 [Buddleja alternifolia]|uniref:Imidazoleglycerol-phosphate dehydratase n=1 Tax=Buddleja alternifolia TaxID=168488 RepID=A0AAV6WQX0_9LAMI|nr:hypothetical protein BUALT_Bualt14G0092800 [Buddleja alternifolia]